MTAKVIYREQGEVICQSDTHGRFKLRIGGCGEAIYLTKNREKISTFPPSLSETIINEYEIIPEDLEIAEAIMTAISLTKQIPNIRVEEDKQIALLQATT